MDTTQRFSILCLPAFILVFCFGFPASLRGDPVAHWKLNKGEGRIFKNQGDENFNGFLENGTVRINWVKVTPGEDGFHADQRYAVEFLGGNSWIQTNFPGIGGSAARTLAFWVKSVTNSPGILSWGDSTVRGGKWNVGSNRWANNGPLDAVRTECGGGGDPIGHIVGTGRIADGRWHHVASVFPEGATKISEVLHYIDGELDPRSGGGDVLVNTAVGGNALPVTIGVTYSGAQEKFFSGALADVRIYDYALDEVEIQEIFRPRPVNFVRGDPDADDKTDLSDAVFVLNYLFTGGSPPTCEDSGDIDDSGVIDITDAVYLLNYLFLGGPQPPAPFPNCGSDPTGDGPDALECEVYPPCEPVER